MENEKGKAKFVDMPPSKEWLSLFVNEEIAEKCKVVYQKREGEEKAKFLELWNPDKEYDEGCMIAPISSIYRGCMPLSIGTKFKNVTGSTNDPNYYGTSWIGMMCLVYDVLRLDASLLKECCSEQNYYTMYQTEAKERVHNGMIFGGHVLVEGAGNRVFLLPICASHNTLDKDEQYMKLNKDIWAVELAYYLS